MSLSAPHIAFYPAVGGTPCAVRLWEAERPMARVVWLHGIISHGGWYAGSCRYLADAGMEAHFLDRRGSGLNAAARGDVDRFETWIRDVELYLMRLPEDLPTVLLGVSWGGKLALALCRHTRLPLAGVGLLCPGLFAHQGPGPAARIAVRLAGRTRLRHRHVTIPLQDPALFTESPSWRGYVASDPFTLRKITLSFAAADQELTSFATETPENVDLPILLMLAGRDRIIDNRRVRGFLERVGSPRKQMVEYPEAAHTLDFEPDPSHFQRDLAEWVRKVVG